jgi:DNA repair protein RAD16
VLQGASRSSSLTCAPEPQQVLVWHGAARASDAKALKDYDIVLTSYAVLESSFRRENSGFKRKGELHKEPSLLHKIKWHRVILDEAHNIKDRGCNTARGAFALKATYRWCLSGTPLLNRVGELFSMLRFLGLDPFAFYYCKKCDCKSMHWSFSNKKSCDGCSAYCLCNFKSRSSPRADHSPMSHTCFWNQEILKPIQKYGHEGQGNVAFGKLRILLERLMLRRTKVRRRPLAHKLLLSFVQLERADDLGLPPRSPCQLLPSADSLIVSQRSLFAATTSRRKKGSSTPLSLGTSSVNSLPTLPTTPS